MNLNRELLEAINRVASESLAAGRLPAEDVLPGVRALDFWSEEPNGAMLFWADREADLCGLGQPVLHDVFVEHVDGTWRASSGASATTEPWEELLASFSAGLDRHSGSSQGSVRVIWATAGPGVALIRLRDQDGGIRDRQPGRHGFVLLGITPEDPITYAYAVDRTGDHLPGGPLLL